MNKFDTFCESIEASFTDVSSIENALILMSIMESLGDAYEELFSFDFLSEARKALSPLEFEKEDEEPIKDNAIMHDLILRWQEKGDIEARNKLLVSNINLIRKVAHKLNLDNRFLKDNISIGVIGFTKALDNFKLQDADKFKTTHFTSYLFTSLRGYMLNEIGRKAHKHASLDVKMKGKDGEGKSFLDDVVGHEPSISDIVRKKEDLVKLRQILANLPEREKTAIGAYFGLAGQKMTYDEVGNLIGMTKMGAQKLIKRTLGELKKEMK